MSNDAYFIGNGLQGFQTPIAKDSFIVDGVGAYGNMHSERGLTYFEVALSGHMVPQFAPVVRVVVIVAVVHASLFDLFNRHRCCNG